MAKAVFVAALLTLAACGGSDRDLPTTIGEGCLDIGEVVCDRLAECDDTVMRNTCETQFYAGCCANDDRCDAPAGITFTEAEYNDCLDDISSAPCPQILNGELPASCR